LWELLTKWGLWKYYFGDPVLIGIYNKLLLAIKIWFCMP